MSKVNVSAVIKIGGSLLGLPDLPRRLANFLGDFGRPYPIAVCGGGPSVDLVRRWDRVYGMDEEACHWIALHALCVTARVVERIAPQLRYVTAPEEFPATWADRKVPLYDAHAFIRDIDAVSATPLPRRWRVTSDSIAARMAVHFDAPELILLKSASIEEDMNANEAAGEGFVDSYFPLAAANLPRIVTFNLRDANPVETVLRPA